MAGGHQEIVAADAGFVPACGATMHRYMLAEDIVVTDDHAGFLTIELEVLRHLTQDGAAKYHIALTHVERPDQGGMGTDDAMVAQIHTAFNHHIRPYLAFFPNIRLSRNDSCGVNTGGCSDRHGLPPEKQPLNLGDR